jgi:hypothetical protein
MNAQNPDNEREWRSQVAARMREALDRSRGYASFWEWPDRTLVELQVARILRSYLALADAAEYGPMQPNRNDPPDVIIVAGDRRIGVEVTELVDGATVERHQHRKKSGNQQPYDWADWTHDSVAEAITRIVERKDRKLAKTAGNFDHVIVAIFTDEPLVARGLAIEALQSCTAKVQHVDRAFLVISYDPSADTKVYPDGYPVLPIALSRS